MESFSFRFVKYCEKFSESETAVDNVNGRVDMLAQVSIGLFSLLKCTSDLGSKTEKPLKCRWDYDN